MSGGSALIRLRCLKAKVDQLGCMSGVIFERRHKAAEEVVHDLWALSPPAIGADSHRERKVDGLHISFSRAG